MTFLNWPTERILFKARAHERKKDIALRLLEEFHKKFPAIEYDLLWESATINSQAWLFNSCRYVRVYGGLVRYPRITKCGLALTLAHETGHHLGGPPFDPDLPWITWQGQADYWAAAEGMKAVFGCRALDMTARGAAQLRNLHEAAFLGYPAEDQPDLSPECRVKIFAAGAAGQKMPICATKAYLGLSKV